MLPGICELINFAASLGTAFLAVWIGQQIVNERLLSTPMEIVHRIVIAVVALAFLLNATQDRGPTGAFLAVGCFVFFLLRALARHQYPHGQRAQGWF